MHGVPDPSVPWLDLPREHPFGLQTLPYGSFRTAPGAPARVGVAVGDDVLDLTAVSRRLLGRYKRLFAGGDLDLLLAAGPAVWREVRASLEGWFRDPSVRDAVESALRPVAGVILELPFSVADFVDFYASEHHARNLGRLLRPGTEPLLPNRKSLPVGYHGRAGTVVVSGTPVVRPHGQWRADDGSVVLAPTRRLDLEAEVGFVVGTPSTLGRPVPMSAFAEHVFGVCLVNDWSARDVQAWEYVPLGPFLGKSFATSISPWITPLAALADARVPLPGQDPEPLDYLRVAEPAGYAIDLEVVVNGSVVSRPPYASMYWSPAQMLAHMTVNGASLRTGDLYGSGTISGPERDQRGSFLELSWGGAEPFTLDDGSTRTYLQDGDTVTLRATAGAITLGEVAGTITPR